ncbi:segregation and condensation protein A [Polluticoccus soli]|uniref:segregation and condensation protein A n=1 Tax=Polluticoccus soli TaxID=3034150 RepID=UPI0023E202E5|nr:segregation/condensation protein A [Flavipsychrobacter sp. JY13-12]
MSATYQIKLPQFEGPFDLLLFFIERDELDIYNIPIHTITKDFLTYIHELESLNIELASEFILFISTLMRIKAKMLLPRREVDAQGNEIDPRQELVDKILEYKRFKEASEQMAMMEAERLLQQKRGNTRQELDALGEEYAEGTEIQTVNTYKLMQAFERVMKKYQDRTAKPQHVVVKYKYSMETQKAFLLDHIKVNSRVAFENLFMKCEDRIHAIFTFLSMLELIQMKYFGILIGSGRNNFIIEWNDNREADLTATLETENEAALDSEGSVKTTDEPAQEPDNEEGLAQ